jgi:hypothetical protein
MQQSELVSLYSRPLHLESMATVLKNITAGPIKWQGGCDVQQNFSILLSHFSLFCSQVIGKIVISFWWKL